MWNDVPGPGQGEERPYTLLQKTTKSTLNGVTTIKHVTEKLYLDGTKVVVDNNKDFDDFEDLKKQFGFRPLGESGASSSGRVGTGPQQVSGGDVQKMQQNEGRDKSIQDMLDTSGSSSDSEDELGTEKFSKFEKITLKEHNRLREAHGVPPLKLNKQICAYAQEWADKLIKENSFQHRPDHKYGENIYTSWSSKPHRPQPRAAVQSWYSEIKKHQFGVEPRSTGTGHFTQIVWKSSQELGVGVAAKDGRIIVVANYSPPGNFVGKYRENVPPLKEEREQAEKHI